jgi:hypothetical protein
MPKMIQERPRKNLKVIEVKKCKLGINKCKDGEFRIGGETSTSCGRGKK